MSKNSTGRNWTKDELILAIDLYCRIPFGKMHSGNDKIIQLSKFLNRTPSSVAMKLVNFASLDPSLQVRSIKGLRNASKLDREVWNEIFSDWEQFAVVGNGAFLSIQGETEREIKELKAEISKPEGDTEKLVVSKSRLVQSFFRNTVLSSYNDKCCFCKMNLKELMVASHIIPWSESVVKRADPTNGLCLCPLHDKAFDRGFLSIDDEYRIMVSPEIKKRKTESELFRIGLIEIEGKEMVLPDRFLPGMDSLEYHRTQIFKS